MGFRSRTEAGQQLGSALGQLRGTDVVVLGTARGGMPVAAEVARALDAPLDVVVVRKVGVPWQPDLAMGAVGEEGAGVVNPEVVHAAGVEPDELADAQDQARAGLAERVAALRRGRSPIRLAGRTAVIVDDGLATGATARVACQAARVRGAARVVVAAPVGSEEALATLSGVAHAVVCLVRPGWFRAVGQWYDTFSPIADEHIVTLLHTWPGRAEPVEAVVDSPGADLDEEVRVRAGAVTVTGHLTVPAGPVGLVVLAYGSGSSRHSPRNRYLAGVLQRSGLGTLLLDLLTPGEEIDSDKVFNIGLLGRRLVEVVAWLNRQPRDAGLRIGVVGAGTGAAAALWAAAEPDSPIAAIVSPGGRPDLAGVRLAQVRVPTLLIVGSHDQVTAELSRSAQERLRCLNRLATVPGATHLFDEPRTLGFAARLAADWFTTRLGPVENSDPRAGAPVASA
jgi:putative phosphoribosyl transferase